MAKIELKSVCKRFSGKKEPKGINEFVGFRTFRAPRSPVKPFSIENLDLKMPEGMTTVILGPSGCGKTTLLRIIAGLEKPDSGEVFYDDKDASRINTKDRNIGMVFQSYALYPHFTSRKNILTYYLFNKKKQITDKEAEIKLKKTSELLGVDINYLLDRHPAKLSGGEKQRVAIGRCITRDPSVFLLDEPFSNLDAKLREKYRVQLKTLLKTFNITSAYVTHDQQEALILSDFLVIMNEGKIIQTGAFEEIYNAPADLFVAEFLNPNSETAAISVIDGDLISEKYKDMLIGVRPEDIEINSREIKESIKGKVICINNIPVKNISVITVSIGEKDIYIKTKSGQDYKPDQEAYISFKKYFLFDKKTEQRINRISR